MDNGATYTTILHAQRANMGISLVEYTICDCIDKIGKPWCYMNQDELGSFADITGRSVRRVLSKMIEKGYIERAEEGVKTTQLWKDSVNIQADKTSSSDGQNVRTKRTKRPKEADKTSSLYIYNNNNTNKQSSTIVDARTEEEKLKRFPDWMGNSYLKRLVYIYSVLWKDSYGFAPTIVNWGQLGKQFSPLVKTYTEYQLAGLIIVHFEWKGASGDSEFDQKVLEDKGYPLDWIPKRASIYKAYLMNNLGVKFDDEVEMKKWVSKIIHPLIKSDVPKSNGEDTEHQGTGGSDVQAS